MLQRRAARQQQCLGAEAVADRAQPGAVRFRVGQAAIVRRTGRRPAQPVDAEVVVAPFPYDPAGEIEQPLLRFGVRAVERVDLAAPRLARLAYYGAARITQQPVGLRRGNPGGLGHAERRHPQTGLEASGVNLVGEPGVAVREALVCLPRPGGSLVAVIEL